MGKKKQNDEDKITRNHVKTIKELKKEVKQMAKIQKEVDSLKREGNKKKLDGPPKKTNVRQQKDNNINLSSNNSKQILPFKPRSSRMGRRTKTRDLRAAQIINWYQRPPGASSPKLPEDCVYDTCRASGVFIVKRMVGLIKTGNGYQTILHSHGLEDPNTSVWDLSQASSQREVSNRLKEDCEHLIVDKLDDPRDTKDMEISSCEIVAVLNSGQKLQEDKQNASLYPPGGSTQQKIVVYWIKGHEYIYPISKFRNLHGIAIVNQKIDEYYRKNGQTALITVTGDSNGIILRKEYNVDRNAIRLRPNLPWGADARKLLASGRPDFQPPAAFRVDDFRDFSPQFGARQRPGRQYTPGLATTMSPEPQGAPHFELQLIDLVKGNVKSGTKLPSYSGRSLLQYTQKILKKANKPLENLDTYKLDRRNE